MHFYFGSPTNAAALDPISFGTTNQLNVEQTNIPNTGQGTVGGFSPIAGTSRTTSSGAMRGYIDEFNLFNRVLTLAEIQQVQIGGTVPPSWGSPAPRPTPRCNGDRQRRRRCNSNSNRGPT